MVDVDLKPPVKTKRISDNFAAHLKRGSATPGVDYVTPVGETIYACERGIVVAASNNPNSGAGRNITIRHRDGSRTIYFHLSVVKVRALQRVKQGQVIGLTGNSGTQTTGPHLHFAIQQKGKFVDPEKVFRKEKRERRAEKAAAVTVESLIPTHEIIPG
jgi:murein DD-endopeptidase MepM/ murein hydrolase activator NlpD